MVYSSATLIASVASAAMAGALIGLLVGGLSPARGALRNSSDESAACTATGVMDKFTCMLCRKKKAPMPKRIILVRHGESEGNIDPLLYCHVPDNAMHLTELGFEQAVAAGKSIKTIIGNESLRFIVSPYVRTIETFQGILKAWGFEGKSIPWTEEPRIREQDFGNFQDPVNIRECKAQRRRFGSFFYRFPSGESPADVYDRMSSFLESLYRMFEKTCEQNYVLVTHGVAIRVILTRYFKYRVSEFEQLQNFHNGEFVVLEYDEQKGKFMLGKVVSNHVALNEDGSVTVETEEADTLRLHPCETMSKLSRPYMSSPINHFRHPPPPPPDTPTSSSSSSERNEDADMYPSGPEEDVKCEHAAADTSNPLPIAVSATE